MVNSSALAGGIIFPSKLVVR